MNYCFVNYEQEIHEKIQDLESIEVICEDLLKYWDKDKVKCNLNIINPNYIVRTESTPATRYDEEQFNIHIGDLLKLGITRKSFNPHRSAAFIVNKHSEIVRGKLGWLLIIKD